MDREIVYIINKEVKRKREFSNISDEFVNRLIINYLSKRNYILEHLKKYENYKQLKKDIYFQDIVKSVRSKLHEIYGIFLPKSINKLWRILESEDSIENKIIELLRQTKPTKERINFYNNIYKNIFEIESPTTILDLASGLNPISIYFSTEYPKKYYFIDLSPDIIYINTYILEKLSIDNEGIEGDILDYEIIPKRDFTYTFLWKTVPIIEDISPGYTKKLLLNINSEYFVLSFSLRKISGKDRMGKAWIAWTRKLSKYLDIRLIKEFNTPNEYFAIIRSKRH